jgi:hypothetical protein
MGNCCVWSTDTILTKKAELRESNESALRDLCKAYVKECENSVITMGRYIQIYEKGAKKAAMLF